MLYDVIARPRVERRCRPDSLASQLRATATSGLALKVPLRLGRTLAGRTLKDLRAQGLRVRRLRQGDHYVAWCERIEAKTA